MRGAVLLVDLFIVAYLLRVHLASGDSPAASSTSPV